MKRLIPAIALALALIPLEAKAALTSYTETFSELNYTLNKDNLPSAIINFDLANTGSQAWQLSQNGLSSYNYKTVSDDISDYSSVSEDIASASLSLLFNISNNTNDRGNIFILISTGNQKLTNYSYNVNTNNNNTPLTIDLSNYLDYLKNGALTIKLTETQGTVTLTSASLTAEVAPKATPTPIPAAGWLLGSGLAGMAMLKRRTPKTRR